MTKDNKSGSAFWSRLKNRYRFQVIDTGTYDVRWVLELSRLNVLTVGSILFLGLFLLSLALFALTPLRFLLPGYVGTNAEEKRAIIELKMKSEALEARLGSQQKYVANLQAILQDSLPLHEDYLQEQERLLQADAEIFFPQAGQLETRFRKDFEILLKQGGPTEVSGTAYVLSLLQKPLEGKPVPGLEAAATASKTLHIKGKPGAGITSVLPGLVIARYKVGQETHLYLQHEEDLVSAYKFQGAAEVSPGDRVDAAQLIGSLSEKGDAVLHFDLWANAEAIPPGQYLRY
jgi:murein DD-endopeptidase MepM/ murein hydrolase activator NlpD